MSNYGYFVIFHSISKSHLVIGVFHQWLHGRFTPKWPSIQWRKCGKMTALKHDEIEWGSFRILRQSIWWDVAISPVMGHVLSLVAVGNPNFRGRGSFFLFEKHVFSLAESALWSCFLGEFQHFARTFWDEQLCGQPLQPGFRKSTISAPGRVRKYG